MAEVVVVVVTPSSSCLAIVMTSLKRSYPIFLPTIYYKIFSILEQRVLKDLVAENLKRGCSDIFCKTIGVLYCLIMQVKFFSDQTLRGGMK